MVGPREPGLRAGGRCRVWCPVQQYNFTAHGLPGYEQATGEEGAHGISLECVDYNNYAPATRDALRRLTSGECRWVKPTTP